MLRRLPLHPGETTAEPIDPDDVAALIAAEARPAPPHRPWVAVNMVTSADGATTTSAGVSGDLGSDTDMAVFGALRSIADVVLAGSGTVTAERYRPPKAGPARRDQRLARGQAPLPRLAVVSNRGDVDLDLPLFSEATPESRPIVLVATNAVDDERRHRLDQVAEVIDAGDSLVDPAIAVRLLGDRTGASVVVCEGGPTLNGLLLAGDLIDEWCLTIGPILAGGESHRGSHGPTLAEPLTLDLARAWQHDGELLLRYVRH